MRGLNASRRLIVDVSFQQKILRLVQTSCKQDTLFIHRPAENLLTLLIALQNVLSEILSPGQTYRIRNTTH